MCPSSDFFVCFCSKTVKCLFFHFCTIWSFLVPPPPLGAVWETAGRGLGDGWGDGWETAGRGLEGIWETCGSRLGEVCGTSGRRLGAHRWPELETTARPGEESSGGGGAGWGSRRCGSGQPAVPAGGISPTESSGCQRAPGPEVVPLHSYPRRGLTHNISNTFLIPMT